METHTLETLCSFVIGITIGIFLEAFTITRKWKAISNKWKEQATRSTAIASTALDSFRAASNLALDQAEAVDDLLRAWEKYRDEAANAPTPESPSDKFNRIAEADRSIRAIRHTLAERTAKRHAEAEAIHRSLSVPEGPQESGPVRAEEGSEAGQR